MIPDLQPTTTRAARVSQPAPGLWRLEIPAGERGAYRLAQLDDYHCLPRRGFPWQPPVQLSLRGRASAADLPGTWGFGLWNDPFSLSLGLGGAGQRFPALPNAAWFFFASPPNYLSFRDDLPAQGFLAATFRSPAVPAPLLGLAAPGLALALLPGATQAVRRLLRRVIRQDAALVQADHTTWHSYQIDWQAGRVQLGVDGQTVLDTPVSPGGRLGLVLWVDNQYATLPPDGRLAYGTLENQQPAWVEVESISMTRD